MNRGRMRRAFRGISGRWRLRRFCSPTTRRALKRSYRTWACSASMDKRRTLSHNRIGVEGPSDDNQQEAIHPAVQARCLGTGAYQRPDQRRLASRTRPLGWSDQRRAPRLEPDPAQVFPGPGPQAAPAAQLAQLRRAIEVLRQERDILKKALAIFSHPQIPSRSSPSSPSTNTPWR
jgi:transposase